MIYIIRMSIKYTYYNLDTDTVVAWLPLCIANFTEQGTDG